MKRFTVAKFGDRFALDNGYGYDLFVSKPNCWENHGEVSTMQEVEEFVYETEEENVLSDTLR